MLLDTNQFYDLEELAHCQSYQSQIDVLANQSDEIEGNISP